MDPALTALATAGAEIIVTAMATDVWPAVKQRLAALFGRARPDDPGAAEAAGGRLDDARRELTAHGADPDDVAADWQRRLWVLLADHPSLAEDLRQLLADLTPQVRAAGGVSGGVSIDVRNIGKDSRSYTVGSGSITVNEAAD